MRAILLIVLALHFAVADDSLPATIPSTFDLDSLGVDSRLLPGVPALTQYQNEVAKAKASYEASIYKAAEELRKKLQQAQEQATKAGDLDKALAIRAAMDKLPKAPKADAPAKAPEIKDRIVGKWRANGAVFTFNVNGTVEHSAGQTGTWKMDKTQKAVFIMWNSGLTDTMVMPDEGATSTSGTGARGQTMAFAKLP